MPKPSALKIFGAVITVVLLSGVFYLRAMQNYRGFERNGNNSNFFFFWLAGRMVLDGQNPYDETQYLAGHDAYGVTWKPNKIFPYPLPLSIFMLPLGLMPLSTAYIAWQFLSQVIVAITVWVLLAHWKDSAHERLLLPVVIFLVFYGPVFLTLQTGAIGAFTLLAILASLLLFEKDKPLLAGMALSLTILKPPQGLTILLLAGVWFFSRRDWMAILGVGIGGLVLLIIGIIQDPLWALKFENAGRAVMERTLGVQSNVWAFSYLACKGISPCSILLGGAGAISILGGAACLIWKNHARLSAWEVFNVIIPFGFISTIYLWAYDQLPYVLPIIWIVGTLVEKKKSYLQAFAFLVVSDIIAFTALILHAFTLKDLWSFGNTLIVLIGILWASQAKQKSPIDTSPKPA